VAYRASIRAVLLLASTVAAAALPSMASSAGTKDGAPRKSIAVEISDLDLSTAAGIAGLQRRIKSAARRVCEDDVSHLYRQYQRRKPDSCYELTVTHAMNQLPIAKRALARESDCVKPVNER
jgi:UrcA family protein